jgi:hypothetical protein
LLSGQIFIFDNGVLKIEEIAMEMLCQAKEKLYGWRGN